MDYDANKKIRERKRNKLFDVYPNRVKAYPNRRGLGCIRLQPKVF